MTTQDGYSHASLPSDVVTLVDLVRKRVEERSERLLFTFLEDGEREGTSWTYAELDRRARSIAALLVDANAAGKRALLVYPPGLDFIGAFFGCLYAGTVAVPVYPPDPARLDRTLPRLRTIAEDADAAFVLTTSDVLALVEPLAAQVPDLRNQRWIATDVLAPELAKAWRDPGVGRDTVAFLQYTSGSTAEPKGVVMTHGNLMHNQAMIRHVFQQGEAAVGVSWLPLYHDMGLIGHVLHPIYIGARQFFMSPLAFLQRPVRWLQAISRYRVSISGAPNFGYDLTARRVTAEQRAGLDLSSWSLAFNGAEPIRAETMRRFLAAFESCGFRWSAFSPCYGLAEATLAVTGSRHDVPPRLLSIDRAALEEHRVAPIDELAERAQVMVGAGQAPPYPELAIVEPESRRRLPPGGVGEIWVSGPHVAQGYWNRPELTAEALAARLADAPADGPFLRTGDFGFVHDGELYVTGRLKDLIIVGGRNHWPQDLELTAERAHPSVRPGGVAAFAVTIDGEERAVIVAELSDPAAEAAAVTSAIRLALVENHGLQPQRVQLVPPRSLPKTSSGKIQRRACLAAYLAGTLG